MITWKDEEFEEDFKCNFGLKREGEEIPEEKYLAIREAYDSFSVQYLEMFDDLQSIKDVKKLDPYKNARNKIKELFDLLGDDETALIETIDQALDRITLRPQTLKNIFDAEAKEILYAVGISKAEATRILRKFRDFRNTRHLIQY